MNTIDPFMFLPLIVLLAVFGIPIFLSVRRRNVQRNGRVTLGTVVAVQGTSIRLNHRPLIDVQLDYRLADGRMHRTSLRSTDPGVKLLQPGARVAIVIAPQNPDRVYLADKQAQLRLSSEDRPLEMPFGHMPLTSVPFAAAEILNRMPDLGSQIGRTIQQAVMQAQANGHVTLHTSTTINGQTVSSSWEGDAVSRGMAQDPITEALGGPPREDLSVAEVVSISALPDGRTSVQAEVIRIAQPRHTIFCTQRLLDGVFFDVGDRVYVRLDRNEPPHAGYIMPLAATGGRRIPRTGNRADSSVLAIDVLFAGSRAQGTILSVEQQQLPEAFARNGASKWWLRVNVQPANGEAAYIGECTLAVSNSEKASHLNRAGLVVPVRYDPEDPATFVIDSIALGFGDPRVAEQEAIRIAMQNGY